MGYGDHTTKGTTMFSLIARGIVINVLGMFIVNHVYNNVGDPIERAKEWYARKLKPLR